MLDEVEALGLEVRGTVGHWGASVQTVILASV